MLEIDTPHGILALIFIFAVSLVAKWPLGLKVATKKKIQQGLKTTCTAHAKRWAKLDENCDHSGQNGIKTLAKMPGNASPDFEKKSYISSSAFHACANPDLAFQTN